MSEELQSALADTTPLAVQAWRRLVERLERRAESAEARLARSHAELAALRALAHVAEEVVAGSKGRSALRIALARWRVARKESQ